MLISIHAPHEGERLKTAIALKAQGVFQSTLPTRGSDYGIAPEIDAIEISIHAPHEGERQYPRLVVTYYYLFQSTLPTRGSDTFWQPFIVHSCRFQSTLPTRGSDSRGISP